MLVLFVFVDMGDQRYRFLETLAQQLAAAFDLLDFDGTGRRCVHVQFESACAAPKCRCLDHLTMAAVQSFGKRQEQGEQTDFLADAFIQTEEQRRLARGTLARWK